MKKIFFLISIVALLMVSCTDIKQVSIITNDGDTISGEYLIRDAQFGLLKKGMSKNILYDLYGQNNVKLLRNEDNKHHYDSLSKYDKYYVYSKKHELLFVASIDQKKGYVERVAVKNGKFKTQQNIGLKSTVADIKKAYDEVGVIDNDGMVFITIPSKDIYFGIDTNDIRGYTNTFYTNISIDSINGKAKPINMVINWAMDESNVFSLRYWKERLEATIIWLMKELPSIIMIILIFIAALKFNNFLCKRIKISMLNKAERDKNVDTEEAGKRITTIIKIFNQVMSIIYWIIFIFAMLSKFDINLGPIVASAGILGLAIGFGSQELIRDFIYGFFMLLEDQIRTGDVAVINGTTGKVEHIALRTVTLRDTSGVVHIFQNGKINSLSNMTKEWSAIVLEIGVAYKENIDNVMDLMREVGAKMAADEQYKDKMLNTVNVLGLDKFGDSAIIIKAIIETRPMQQWDIKREYQRRLKIAFDENNIEIPFPHLSLYTGEASKPLHINIDK